MKRYGDWQTVVIMCVGLFCCTAVILMGKGNVLLQVLAAVGGSSGIAALLKYSPLHGPPNGDESK